MKKIISIILVAILTITALPLTVFAADTKSSAVDPTKYLNDAFFIKNKNSGKYLDVKGGSAKNGANAIQWGFTGKSNQQWKLQKQSNGTYKIVSALSGGYTLDIAGKSAKNGANAQIWKSSQTFRLVKVSGTYYKLESVVSGSAKKAIGVTGSSKKDGANVNQWTFGKTGNDQWQFERVVKSSGNSNTKATKATKTSNILTTSGLIAHDGDFFYVRNASSNRYLSVSGGKASSGTNVLQWDFNGKKEQQWKFVYAGNAGSGRYYGYLVSALGDGKTYALDLAGGSTKTGANLQISKWNKSNNNQLFRFELSSFNKSCQRIATKATDFTQVVTVQNVANGANVNQGVYSHRQKDDIDWSFEHTEAIPNGGIGDKEMDRLVKYAQEYGLSIGLYNNQTNANMAGKWKTSWDTPIPISETSIPKNVEKSIRSGLDRMTTYADGFGVWYSKDEYEKRPGESTYHLYLIYFIDAKN